MHQRLQCSPPETESSDKWQRYVIGTHIRWTNNEKRCLIFKRIRRYSISIVDVSGPGTLSWQGGAALSTLWRLCLLSCAYPNILRKARLRTDIDNESNADSVAHDEAKSAATINSLKQIQTRSYSVRPCWFCHMDTSDFSSARQVSRALDMISTGYDACE